MNTILKYKVIKDKDQYYAYCNALHELLGSKVNADIQNEIELLTLLIESYDKKHHISGDSDPITLLKSFMEDHQLAADRLATILNINDEHVAAILDYRKRLSKVLARKLAKHFKVREEAFNKFYQLKTI